jgi:hypothetical protein
MNVSPLRREDIEESDLVMVSAMMILISCWVKPKRLFPSFSRTWKQGNRRRSIMK